MSKVIRDLVTENGNVLGAKLGMELKAAVPDWNAAEYGASSLRQFIVDHVDGVVVAGRSGMDVVYACSDAAPLASGKSSTPDDAWRAWVSPNSPFALAISIADGTVVLLKGGAAVPEGHARIASTTVDEHRAIARDYVEQVPEPARESMRAVAESPNEQWWRDWLTELKKLKALSAWNAFRRKRLGELLKTRLESAGIEPSAQSTAVSALAQSRQTPRDKPPLRNTRITSTLRGVVAAVIVKMGDADLRDLKLPIGLVLDALDEMKS